MSQQYCKVVLGIVIRTLYFLCAEIFRKFLGLAVLF